MTSIPTTVSIARKPWKLSCSFTPSASEEAPRSHSSPYPANEGAENRNFVENDVLDTLAKMELPQKSSKCSQCHVDGQCHPDSDKAESGRENEQAQDADYGHQNLLKK